MSVDIRRCAERALPAFINNDWQVMGRPPTVGNLTQLIAYLIEKSARGEDVALGDFSYHSTNRILVERRCYEDGETDLEVMLVLGDENDTDG